MSTTKQETKQQTLDRREHEAGRGPGRRRRTAAGAATVLTAAALAAALAGCASKNSTVQPESVSTANASSAAAQAQNATCPSSAPKTLTSNVSGLATKLQPLDATQVLLCVYAGHFGVVSPATSSSAASGSGSASAGASASASASASGSATTHLTLTDPSVVSGLSNALNALAVPPSGRISCPMDSGGSVLAVFTAGQQEVEVMITTSGCQEASNGQKTGWVGASDFAGVLAAALRG